jgi:ribonucleoside-diphosphate reductase alpha chain
VDWETLRQNTRTAIRFLDNVVEVNRLPIPEIETQSRATRKLGLGVMGFAELLIRLGIRYGTPRAVSLADRLMRTIAEAAWATSRTLAQERGVFPAWGGSVFETRGDRVRNATCTAIAPTGTIGIIADTTPGIEPLFALAYRRTGVLGGQTLPEINPLLAEQLERCRRGAEGVLQQVLATGSLQGVPGVPRRLQRVFATALEVSPRQHLLIQAAFQRHVDNAVSKTINLPSDASPGDVARAYRMAWELGLKGVTVYRYGSRESQVLELGVGDQTYQFDHASRCDPEECRVSDRDSGLMGDSSLVQRAALNLETREQVRFAKPRRKS